MSCSGRARQLANDVAVREEQDPVRDRGSTRLVGDHDDRLVHVLDRVPEQLEDLTARLRVEVAGRLVGEDHVGP